MTDATPHHEPTQGLYGHITHTDLRSNDPGATVEWCMAVFGWTFRPPFRSNTGDYHLFAYSEQGGGGVRTTAAGEDPGATPFVHVEDCHAAFAKAIEAGAEGLAEPESPMPGVTIALVKIPGGLTIGLSGP